MSYGQLFPHGDVPSAGDRDRRLGRTRPSFALQRRRLRSSTACPAAPATARRSATLPGTPSTPSGSSTAGTSCPATPATTARDADGSALIGALAGVGALQAIDSGCGPTGKAVYDAAQIADPEIDYSDYDTDKDGVVDFFMMVFAGCGGNGASQLERAALRQHLAALVEPRVLLHRPATRARRATSPTTSSRTSRAGRSATPTRRASQMTTTDDARIPVFVRVGPYNVNPETAIDKASVISHEYGHSLGLPDFYSTGSRETYGDWNLMATDKSQNMDVFGKQELGWLVPRVLKPGQTDGHRLARLEAQHAPDRLGAADGTPYTLQRRRA